eukprot:760377-Pleurochrysis_carterae.AAC.2
MHAHQLARVRVAPVQHFLQICRAVRRSIISSRNKTIHTSFHSALCRLAVTCSVFYSSIYNCTALSSFSTRRRVFLRCYVLCIWFVLGRRSRSSRLHTVDVTGFMNSHGRSRIVIMELLRLYRYAKNRYNTAFGRRAAPRRALERRNT